MQIGLEDNDTLPKLSARKKEITDSDFQAKVKNLPKEIEEVVASGGGNYIDAVVYVCEKYGLEVEGMKLMLPKNIKEKIEKDASDLNMLKYKVNSLV
jgi:predicted PP-loop superfamily ATPase